MNNIFLKLAFNENQDLVTLYRDFETLKYLLLNYLFDFDTNI